jgi:hypothetical protein
MKSNRGSYRPSQEADMFHSRTRLKFFDFNGCLAIGVNKGKPFNKLPDHYIVWACREIQGFKRELDIISGMIAPEAPKSPGKRPSSSKKCPSSKKKKWKKTDWTPGPSKLVQEVIQKVKDQEVLTKNLDHNYLDPDFTPQEFTEDDAPPW